MFMLDYEQALFSYVFNPLETLGSKIRKLR